MHAPVKLACEVEVKLLPLAKLLPTKAISPETKHSSKYKCIAASVLELGIIEPLVVFPRKDTGAGFLLLDGHVRLEIMRDLGEAEVPCLVATDDEAFTYNHKVNRLTAIQEHFMVLRAIKNGLSEHRLAKALDLDVGTIRKKADLLDGICPEAVQLLKEKRATAGALREIRKAKPMRQMEIAELMRASSNYSVGYAKCLIATSASEELLEPDKTKEFKGLTPDDVARMERETATLAKEFKLIEESHGRNTLELILAVGYLKKLLDNARVVRFLSQHHPEILAEFQKLVETKSLKDAG